MESEYLNTHRVALATGVSRHRLLSAVAAGRIRVRVRKDRPLLHVGDALSLFGAAEADGAA